MNPQQNNLPAQYQEMYTTTEEIHPRTFYAKVFLKVFLLDRVGCCRTTADPILTTRVRKHYTGRVKKSSAKMHVFCFDLCMNDARKNEFKGDLFLFYSTRCRWYLKKYFRLL